MTTIGRISELRRYPVKSMLGELLPAANVLTRGLEGDRVCALIDEETSKVASAKRPQRWRRLFEFSASYDEPTEGISVVLPGGQRIDPRARDANGIVSSQLGRAVRFAFSRPAGLAVERSVPEQVAERGEDGDVDTPELELGMEAPEGGFFDLIPIHLLTTASLDRVAEVSLSRKPEAVRFRPNIVIDSAGLAPFAENDWSGKTLAIGPELRLQIVIPTPRCAVPTLAQGDVGPDRRLTLEISKLNKCDVLDLGMMPCVGAYARVAQPGRIHLGDDVRLM